MSASPSPNVTPPPLVGSIIATPKPRMLRACLRNFSHHPTPPPVAAGEHFNHLQSLYAYSTGPQPLDFSKALAIICDVKPFINRSCKPSQCLISRSSIKLGTTHCCTVCSLHQPSPFLPSASPCPQLKSHVSPYHPLRPALAPFVVQSFSCNQNSQLISIRHALIEASSHACAETNYIFLISHLALVLT